MDTRNGNLYPNAQAAYDAGVPEEHIHKVHVTSSGPFKGRIYLLNDDDSLGQRVDLIMKQRKKEQELALLKEKECELLTSDSAV